MNITEYLPSQFNELEIIWKSLETGKEMTIFQSFEWYKWINSSYLKERTKNHFREWKYLVCYSNNGEPLMIAPIQIIKIGRSIKGVGLDKGAYFIGRKGYTDYLNFVYSSFSEQAAISIIRYISQEYRVSNFCFEQLLESTSLSACLLEKFKAKTNKQLSSAALVFPETKEEYLQMIKKHAKQNFRTAINRQKRDNLAFSHSIVYKVDNSLQSQMINIRAQRLKEKEKRATSKISSKLYNWCRKHFIVKFNANVNVFDNGLPQWAFLVKKDELIVGFYWGICDLNRKCYYVIFAGVSKEYEWYSPSISHLYQWIQELYDEKNTEFSVIDFTLGDERYKTDIGGTVRYVNNYSFSM